MLNSQHIFLENHERISLAIKKYPHVISVGVGLKETGEEITSTLCYRVYVSEKKFLGQLQQHEIIPAEMEGFATDVIDYGVVEEMAGAETVEMDNGTYRPVTGGIQIKNDLYVGKSKRGGGTLGCLAILNDDEHTDLLVALTCQHVVAYNSTDNLPENEIGQPWKRICCCFWTKDVIGYVYDSKKDKNIDCAIVKLHQDVINDINNHGAKNEILEVGSMKGKAVASVVDHTLVKKRGAATKLTYGKVVDVAFDGTQILIAPLDPEKKFADFGDSGSIILTEDNKVIGLLWGTKRDRFDSDDPAIPDEDPRNSYNRLNALKHRVHGVATPIEAIEAALKIKIPVPQLPDLKVLFFVHPNDTKTHLIKSNVPGSLQQHFVTVRSNEIMADIPDDILLHVSFTPSIDAARVKWTYENPEKLNEANQEMPVTFPAVGTDNLTAKISRKVFPGSYVKVGVTVDGYSVGEKIFVWVVWADINYPLPTIPIPIPTIDNANATIEANFEIEFAVWPYSLFDLNKDVPDLRGANETPPPDVPSTDPDVYNKGVSLAGGAKYKWDFTTQIRSNILNPDAVTLPANDDYKTFISYPSSELVGNLDTGSVLDLDPYSFQPPAKIGIIVARPQIKRSLSHGIGLVNNTIQLKIYARIFIRLELNKTWYTISYAFPIKTLMTFIKMNETGWGDMTGDGNESGTFWRNGLSFLDYDDYDF